MLSNAPLKRDTCTDTLDCDRRRVPGLSDALLRRRDPASEHLHIGRLGQDLASVLSKRENGWLTFLGTPLLVGCCVLGPLKFELREYRVCLRSAAKNPPEHVANC